MNRLTVSDARFTLGQRLENLGYRMQRFAVTVSGGRTLGPDALTFDNVCEVARLADIPLVDLIKRMEGSHTTAA
jgi:hypothetical protein